MTTEMPPLRYELGGLMRCCIATLHEHWFALDERPDEGATLPCQWCSAVMIFGNDDVWRWVPGT